MNECSLELDKMSVTDILQRLTLLTDKEMRSAKRSVLKQCGGVMLRAYRKNIIRAVPGASHSRWKDVKPLAKSGKLKTNKEGTYVLTHIMDTFTAKWFELGTNVRYTHTKIRRKNGVTVYKQKAGAGKPAHRGKIKAQYNFDKAIQSSNAEVSKLIEDRLTRTITRRWEKKRAE